VPCVGSTADIASVLTDVISCLIATASSDQRVVITITD
jgi:hypothetical protein